MLGGEPVSRSFLGEYKCSADAKGRLMVPSKLRECFPEGEQIYLVRSLDHCINLYTESRWNVFEEKILSLPEKYRIVGVLSLGVPGEEREPHTLDEADFTKVRYLH